MAGQWPRGRGFYGQHSPVRQDASPTQPSTSNGVPSSSGVPNPTRNPLPDYSMSQQAAAWSVANPVAAHHYLPIPPPRPFMSQQQTSGNATDPVAGQDAAGQDELHGRTSNVGARFHVPQAAKSTALNGTNAAGELAVAYHGSPLGQDSGDDDVPHGQGEFAVRRSPPNYQAWAEGNPDVSPFGTPSSSSSDRSSSSNSDSETTPSAREALLRATRPEVCPYVRSDAVSGQPPRGAAGVSAYRPRVVQNNSGSHRFRRHLRDRCCPRHHVGHCECPEGASDLLILR